MFLVHVFGMLLFVVGASPGEGRRDGRVCLHHLRLPAGRPGIGDAQSEVTYEKFWLRPIVRLEVSTACAGQPRSLGWGLSLGVSEAPLAGVADLRTSRLWVGTAETDAV